MFSPILTKHIPGFDGYIIVSALVELGVDLQLVIQGPQLVVFTEKHYNQQFIDSASFLSFPLSQLPKFLGFEHKVKGHFPHHFSSEGNLNYVGPYLAVKY